MASTRYAVVGGCVAPAQLAQVLAQLQQETGCTYESIYRGEDAAALLHKLGKSTQTEIYWQYTHGLEPNPANPPGRSTHELRSDGVAYAGPIGRALPWWCCGIDVDDAHANAFSAAAARHGWMVIQPYHSGSEFHHRNFTKPPAIANPFLPLHEGQKGKARPSTGLFVYILSARLKNCGYLKQRTSTFDQTVYAAVRRFQEKHRLAVDGVAGPQTWANLKAADRACRRNHHTEV